MKKMASADRRAGGFTLVEGMVAAAILATGLLAVASMQGMSLAWNVDSTELGRATNLATDMVERIQFNRRNVTAYNNIDTMVGCTQDATAQLMARGDCSQWITALTDRVTAGLIGVQGLVTVTPIVTNPPLNQSQVVVIVRWTGLSGANKVGRLRTVTLNTVIAPE